MTCGHAGRIYGQLAAALRHTDTGGTRRVLAHVHAGLIQLAIADEITIMYVYPANGWLPGLLTDAGNMSLSVRSINQGSISKPN